MVHLDRKNDSKKPYDKVIYYSLCPLFNEERQITSVPSISVQGGFSIALISMTRAMVSYRTAPWSGLPCLFQGRDSFLISINSCRCSGVRSARIRSIVPRRCLLDSALILPMISTCCITADSSGVSLERRSRIPRRAS